MPFVVIRNGIGYIFSPIILPTVDHISGSSDIRAAFAYCEELARTHYENFPVASRFLPRAQRPFVAAVYAFARTADDFADEGNLPAATRLAKLDDWQQKLDDCYEGRADHPVFVALAETAARTGIPRQLFADLLTAFRLDVTTTRFRDAGELMEYCSFSANPVGRIILHIFGNATPRTFVLSDSICSGLQLANFCQDVSVDWRNGRLYIPLEDLDRFGYTEAALGEGRVDARFIACMQLQVSRARNLLVEGRPLVQEAVPPLRFELALTVRGGLAILGAVEHVGWDVLHHRPALSLMTKAAIVAAALADRMKWKTPQRT
jgi:squalene synthase HpnC